METWKDVIGYEGLYQASTEGRIKSLDRYDCRGNRRTGTVLKPRLINSGYLIVHLRDRSGNRKGVLVHRIIAQTFLEARDGEIQVDHIDEDKTNNCVTNLRWVTPKENTNHGTGIERAAITRSRPVKQFDKSGKLIGQFTSATDAARKLNIKQGSITNCCRGKHEHAGGFKWEYAY